MIVLIVAAVVSEQLGHEGLAPALDRVVKAAERSLLADMWPHVQALLSPAEARFDEYNKRHEFETILAALEAIRRKVEGGV